MQYNFDTQIFDQRFAVTPVLSEPLSCRPRSALRFNYRDKVSAGRVLVNNCLIDGSGCLSGLKLSFVYDMTFRRCRILGGSKSCVDVVRGGNLSFEECTFDSKSSIQHISIRGGAKNISFSRCVFQNDYSRRLTGACVNLGGWTDYDDVPRPPVRNVSIKDCVLNGMQKNVLSMTMFSERPSVENSEGKNLRAPKAFVLALRHLMRKGWLGSRKRLPKSQLGVYSREL